MSEIFILTLFLAIVSPLMANNSTQNSTTQPTRLNFGVLYRMIDGVLFRYEGELVPHGKGVYYHNNTKWYEGESRHGYLHGNGTMYHPNGVKESEGVWNNGLLNGSAKIFYENGLKKYEGDVKNDSCTGKGTLYYESGLVDYIGDFVDNREHGKGVSFYENGKKQYEGEWRNGSMHGKGIFYYDGELTKEKYVGQFENGKIHGYGTLYRFKEPPLSCMWIEDICDPKNMRSVQTRLRSEGLLLALSALISFFSFYL